ncbi:LuxR C-terminal-related transcriptional regulator [Paraburkholderia sp. B3]|uniref:helix-turn-helix transcriptional regulator n=1 Tax=Paraburkholderia sp. B3 TaxID=3134791 RepID=UPI003981B1EF
MRLWNIPDQTSRRVDDRSLLPLIDAIGVESASALSSAVLNSLKDQIKAGHCSIFHYQAIGKVRLVSGADRFSQSIAIENARPYIAGGIFRLDTNQDILGDKANNRPAASFIHHQTVSDLRAPAHRELYFNADLLERVSLLHCLRDGSWAAINLYRQRGEGGISEQEFRALENLAIPIAHCVARHIELKGEQPSATSIAPLPESSLLLEIQNRFPDIPRREREVMCALLRGLTADGIACHLNLGVATVVTYKQRLFRRLGINTRAQLFALFSRCA